MTRRSFLGRLGATVLGAVGGSAVAAAVAPEERGGFPLLRPHLHDRLLPIAVSPPAHRPGGLSASPARREADRQSGAPRERQRLPDQRVRSTAGRPGREAAPEGAAHPDLPGLGSGALPHRCPDPGLLVSVLQRPDPKAGRLLLPLETEDQRGRCASRVLLCAPKRVLRHVLRHGNPVLIEAAVVTAALVAGISGAWSP